MKGQSKIAKDNTIVYSSIVVITVVLFGGTYLTNANFKAMLDAYPNSTFIVVDNLWFNSDKHQIHILTRLIDGYSRWRITEDKWNQLYSNGKKIGEWSFDIEYFRTYGADKWVTLIPKRTLVEISWAEHKNLPCLIVKKTTPYYASGTSGSGGVLVEEYMLPYDGQSSAKLNLTFFPSKLNPDRTDDLHRISINLRGIGTYEQWHSQILFEGLQFDFSDVDDKITDWENGTIVFMPMVGEELWIDPIIKVGKYAIDYKLIEGQIAGRTYTPQCLGDCHLLINITLNQNLIISDSDLSYTIKEKIGRDVNIKENGVDYLTKTSYVEQRCTVDIECKNTTTINGSIIENCWESKRVCENVTLWKDFWMPVSLSSVSFTKDKNVILDFWIKREPILGKSSIDFIPKMQDFSFSSCAWWDSNWAKKVLVNISNTGSSISRTDEGVDVILDFTTNPSNATEEVRVTMCDTQNQTSCSAETEIKSQVWNCTASDDICNIVFLANVSAYSFREFYVYYSNDEASYPAYGNQLIVTKNIIANYDMINGYRYDVNISKLDAQIFGDFANYKVDNIGQILDETYGQPYHHGISASGAQWLWDEGTETCTLLTDGPVYARYLCEPDEDSNEDGDCDAGETCIFYKMFPDYFDRQVVWGSTTLVHYTVGMFDEGVRDANCVYYDDSSTCGLGSSPWYVYITPTQGCIGVNLTDSTADYDWMLCWDENINNEVSIETNGIPGNYIQLYLGHVSGDLYRINSDITLRETFPAEGSLATSIDQEEEKFDNPLITTLGSEESQADDISPIYFNCHQNVTNNTAVDVNTVISFGCQWNDDVELDSYVNSSKVNNSGSWTNGTWQSFTTGNWTNFTIKFPSDETSNITVKIYANDTSDNQNVSGTWFWYNIIGDLPPTYSLNSTNSTIAGTPIEHRLKWEDDLGLSGYIFQFCNGTWNGTNCLGSYIRYSNSYYEGTTVLVNGTIYSGTPLYLNSNDESYYEVESDVGSGGGDIFYIRTDDDGPANDGTETVTFTNMPDTNYAALATPLTDNEIIYSLKVVSKTIGSTDWWIQEDTGLDEASLFMYAAIAHGHMMDNSKHIECGSESGAAISTWVVTFDTAFPDENYAVACNSLTDSDSPICIIQDVAYPKTTTGFGMFFNDDGGSTESVSGVDWCAFQHGEYDIGEVSIKAGSTYALNGVLSVTFDTAFSETNYVVFTTDGTSYSSDGCQCEVDTRLVGGFSALCTDDGGSTGNCDETFDWVAIENGDFDSEYGASTISVLNITHNSTAIAENLDDIVELNISLNFKSNVSTIYYFDIYNWTDSKWYQMQTSSVGTSEVMWNWLNDSSTTNFIESADKTIMVRLRANETEPFRSQEDLLIFNITNITEYCWENDTWEAFSSNPDWSNVTKTVNNTLGAIVAWCVYANDTSNNWNGTSCADPFTYTTTEIIPPIITFSQPTNITYTTTSVWVNVTLNEAGSWCGRSRDGGANITMTNSTGNWNNLMTGLAQGAHNVKVCCNDTAGNMNCSSEVRYFSVDTKAPTFDNATAGTNSTIAGSDVKHFVEWSDNVGLSGYIFQFCNGTWNGSDCVGNEILYESYTENNWYVGETLFGIGWAAQTFTVGNRGINDSFYISSVEIYAYREGSPTKFNVSIRNVNETGYPIGEDLSFGSIDASLITTSSSGEFVHVNMSSYNLKPSTQYAIVFRATGTVSNWIIYYVDKEISTYTGGNWFVSATSGSSWGILYDGDVPFKVYGYTGWNNDTWVEMTGTGNWSNVTKVVNSTVGSTIAWRVYANDTSDNWNKTDIYVYTTTGEAAPDYNITYGPDETLRLVWDGNDTGSYCGPDYASIYVEPFNQTNDIGIYKVCNNGTTTGDFKMNLSGTPNTGWVFMADDTSTPSSGVQITTTKTTVKSSVSSDTCFYTYVFANCTNVNVGPGISLKFYMEA